MKVYSGRAAQMGENQLMAALPLRDRENLQPMMTVVQMTYRQLIQLSGEQMGVVYFPITAVLSLVSVMSDGSSTELGLVGNEGMAGLPALLGLGAQPFEMEVVVTGTVYRMSASALTDAAHLSAPLMNLLLRYTQMFLDRVAQGAACSTHHTVKQRLARLLMTIHDAIQSDQLCMTQEFLSHMLGVGRPRVSLALAIFQGAGLIQCSRGSITVIDRSALATAACECYQITRDEYIQLYP